jgi:hypothetical protein
LSSGDCWGSWYVVFLLLFLLLLRSSYFSLCVLSVLCFGRTVLHIRCEASNALASTTTPCFLSTFRIRMRADVQPCGNMKNVIDHYRTDRMLRRNNCSLSRIRYGRIWGLIKRGFRGWIKRSFSMSSRFFPFPSLYSSTLTIPPSSIYLPLHASP